MQEEAKKLREERRASSSIALGLLLMALVFVSYAPSLTGGFIWDDDFHVAQNAALRSGRGLLRIWFNAFMPGEAPVFPYGTQYYPVTFTSFWAEYHLWGLTTAGYRIVNVLLHGGSAVLFWRLLVRQGVRGAWIAAALFAVHPMMAESVAWITERKNTLSLFLGLVAMHLAVGAWGLREGEEARRRKGEDRSVGLEGRGQKAEARTATPPPEGGSTNGVGGTWGGWSRGMEVFWVTLVFTLAVLAKTVVCVMPAVLLVLVWWKRGRVSLRRDVLPALPMFVIGAGLGLLTAHNEHAYVQAQGSDFALSGLERVLLAARSACFYIGKLVWPYPLVFFYPRWRVSAGDAAQWVFIVAVAAWLAGAWWWTLCCRGAEWVGRDGGGERGERVGREVRGGRGLLAATLIYLGCLFPALGFFNVYPFVHSYVADHFAYHASLAVFAVAGAGWEGWWRWSGGFAAPLQGADGKMNGTRGVAPGYESEAPLAQTAPADGGTATMAYADTTAFASVTPLAQTPQGWTTNMAPTVTPASASVVGLGQTPQPKGGTTNKKASLIPVIVLAGVIAMLGAITFQHSKSYTGLETLWRDVLAKNPNSWGAQMNLAVLLYQTGQWEESEQHAREALRLHPTRAAELKSDLAQVAMKKGDVHGALALYEELLKEQPENANARFNYGLTLMRANYLQDAVFELRKAVAQRPQFWLPWLVLAQTYAKTNDAERSLLAAGAALRMVRYVEPSGRLAAFNTIGNTLMEMKMTKTARTAFEAALRVAPGDAFAEGKLSELAARTASSLN